MIINILKITFRNFIKYRTYSLLNILGLATGITSTILISLYVIDELSYDKFWENSDNIHRVVIDFKGPEGNFDFARTAPLIGPTLKDEIPEIQEFNRFNGGWPVLVKNEDVNFYEENIFFTDPNVFDLFSFDFIYGDKNDALNSPNSIVLSESLAKKLFRSTDEVDKTIQFEKDQLLKVTGIFKDIPQNTHIKINGLATYPKRYENFMNRWNSHVFYTYVSSAPEVKLNQLNKKLNEFTKKHYGSDLNIGESVSISLQPIHDIHLHSDRMNELEANGNYSYVIIFGIVAIFILAIASINFVNLSTARSTLRAKEIGVRQVIGANRKMLFSQFISESIILTVISVLLSILCLKFMLPYFNNFIEKGIEINYLNSPIIISSIILFTLLLGFISGVYPALYLSSLKPINVFSGKVGELFKGNASFFRKALVVFQFTISVCLITSTIIVSSQINYLLNKDIGFEKDQVLVVPISDFKDDILENYDALRNMILSKFDIDYVTISGDIPGRMATTLAYNIEGMPENDYKAITALLVEPDFLKTYQMEIIAGRDFDRTMQTDLSEAFVINESAVRNMGINNPEEVIGKRFYMKNTGKIIGVVKDFNFNSLHQNVEPLAMTYFTDWFGYVSIKLNPNNIEKSIDFIQSAFYEFVPGMPFDYFFFDEDFNKQYKADIKFKEVFLSFAVLAVFIACLGLIGLISFTAERKTKEIGIRKVLGASELSISYLLVKEFLLLVIIANLIALPFSLFITNSWLNNFAYKLSIGWDSFVLSGLITLVVAITTVGYQALKASFQNPVKSIRSE